MKAGFAQIDITPPPGTLKIGWLEELYGEVVLDPLFARIAVFDDGRNQIGFIQLDTLSIRWTQVNNIRRRIAKAHGFPGAGIMLSATHNHAGPAVAGFTPLPRDEAYIQTLEERCTRAFGEALARLVPAELGCGRMLEPDVAHNRRVRLRDGRTRSQASPTDPLFLCLEGPIDPELAVLAARGGDGRLLGCLVNYACHPTHHGGTNELSAGFPGVIAARLQAVGCPVSLYLNGAYGNVITTDHLRGTNLSKEQAGQRLADDVESMLASLEWSPDWPLRAAARTIEVDYREITDDEYYGRVFGAQRFRSNELYEGAIDRLRELITKRGCQPVELQVLGIGALRFAGVPAEYFVEFQLRIKEACHPLRAFVVGGANGMVGYVPTAEAFARGGYETTLGPPSKLAPDAGDRIAETIIDMVRQENRD